MTIKLTAKLATTTWIATDPTEPRVAASIMVETRPVSFTNAASAAVVLAFRALIAGKWPSLKSRLTASSTTVLQRPVRTTGLRSDNGT